MKSMKKGFTLVELMVVIVIIGILAALAIPRFLGATNKSKATEFRPILKQIYTLQEANYEANDVYSTDLAAIAFEQPNASASRFTYAAVAPKRAADLVLATATYIVGKGINDVTGTELTASDIACVDVEGDQAVATATLSQVSGVPLKGSKAGLPAACP